MAESANGIAESANGMAESSNGMAEADWQRSDMLRIDFYRLEGRLMNSSSKYKYGPIIF